MSHFSVIVFCKNPHSQLENLLVPFHEFECTGIDDEYIKNIDLTDEAISAYNARSEHYQDLSQLDFISDWYGSRIVPYGEDPDISGDHKYGYITVDELGNFVSYIRRTNPNSKWDWYQIGGRWSCYFKPKEGSDSGMPGEKSWGWQSDGVTDDYVDSILKQDIDIEGMRVNAMRKAHETWDKLDEILRGEPLPSWNKIRDSYENIEFARFAYNNLDIVRSLNSSKDFAYSFGDLVETYCNNRLEYVQKQCDNVIVPFAFVDENGTWHERGEMGWWGISFNEVDKILVPNFLGIF